MESLISDLSQTFRECDEEVDELEREVEILRTRWQGEAADAYLRAQNVWIRDEREKLSELFRRIQALAFALHTYKETEKKIIAICR